MGLSRFSPSKVPVVRTPDEPLPLFRRHEGCKAHVGNVIPANHECRTKKSPRHVLDCGLERVRHAEKFFVVQWLELFDESYCILRSVIRIRNTTRRKSFRSRKERQQPKHPD